MRALEFRTGHVIFKLCCNQIYQLKTTIVSIFYKTLIPFEIAGGLNNLMQNDKPAIMQIRCKFGSLGETERQFHSPHGFCMGPNEEIIVADTFNHRIQVFKSQN